MATELALECHDKTPLGSLADVQDIIRDIFPEVKFGWTTSGPEKLRIAAERGITLPPQLAKILETLPSLLEGRHEAEEYFVEFGLGHEDPVLCLYVTPRGDGAELTNRLSALEERFQGTLVVSGDTNP